jgi:hypothetical protein
LHDAGHRHSQSGRKILFCHCVQPLGIVQQTNQARRETFRVARLVKFDRQILPLSHLLKIFKISASNWNAVGAGQVGDPAAPSRGGIGHDRHGRSLKQVRQTVFMHIASKLNSGVRGAFLLNRFNIAGNLRMIAACNHEFHIGQLGTDQTKRFDHELQPFVGSPFAKREYTVRTSSPRKIRIFRASSENAVSAYMNVVAAVFVEENLAISRHQY